MKKIIQKIALGMMYFLALSYQASAVNFPSLNFFTTYGPAFGVIDINANTVYGLNGINISYELDWLGETPDWSGVKKCFELF